MFSVLGKSATKGSTRSFISNKTGRIVTMADNRKLGEWTQAAKWAARQAGAHLKPKPEPVSITAHWQFILPKRAKGRTDHTVKPDIDKLLRALLDAMTGIAYEDDSQVTSVTVTKSYGPYEECHVVIE